MKHYLCFLCIAFSLLFVSGCSSEETPVAGIADSAAATADPLSGTWTGDWGPSETHRNPVTVALQWDGKNLTGTLNPGPEAVSITKASFAPDTGMVAMEASTPGRGGELVLFVIEGKLADGAITGSWVHDNKKGDFKIKKS